MLLVHKDKRCKMLWIILTTFVSVLIIYLYKVIKQQTEYWKDQPIKYIPAWPIVGNYGNQAFQRKAFVHVVQDMYRHFPDERYIGITMYFTPSLMIRDLDLIKTIAIKDFDHFTDHCGSELESVDPLMCKNLFLLPGQRWKDMRDTLSPAFTSVKMKAMFGFMVESAKQFLEQFEQSNDGIIEVEMKEIICRYANDVIATCAYGIEVNSFKNKDNEFYKIGSETLNFVGWKKIKIMLLQSCPALLKFFRIPIIGQRETKFFRTLTDETIAYRKKTNIVRSDMIHLLMQAQKGELNVKKEDDQMEDIGFATQQSPKAPQKMDTIGKVPWKLTNEDISAQAFVFFLGGFDTASTVMSFLTYELAMNLNIQRRLQDEIDKILSNCKNGLPSYDMIIRMKYMDMIICESLRKWTPATQIDRVCSKEYTIQPVLPHESPLTVKKGSLIMFPICAIHYDEKYYPDPYKFDPERFSDENRKNIVPNSYLPFGIGPRFCIGNRFAILEMKVLMFYLLAKYEISLTSKSTVPFVLDTNLIMPKVAGGFNLGLKLRKK